MKIDPNQLQTALLFLFFFVAVFAFFKPHYFSNRYFSLFRVLLPSWRFFEDLGPVPKLYCRVRSPQSEFSSWSLLLEPKARHFSQIFFNPSGNLRLACHSLVEQTFLDINDQSAESADHFSETVSYQLLQNLVEFQILKGRQYPDKVLYQFQIQVTLPNGETYQALLSEEHEATWN